MGIQGDDPIVDALCTRNQLFFSLYRGSDSRRIVLGSDRCAVAGITTAHEENAS